MSTTAAFASIVAPDLAQLTDANTNRDGTGTVVTVSTGATDGDRIDDIELCAAGTVTDGVIRLYISDGTNTRLVKEVLVSATTPSTTQAVWSAKLINLGWLIRTNWLLKASTHNAETFNIYVSRKGSF